MQTDAQPVAAVEGPVDSGRWGSVGFLADNPIAPRECRQAARWMLERWRLGWVPDLIPDTLTMVSELVTNVQRYGSPVGSFTLWHPDRWLILTVHDKAPIVPARIFYGRSLQWGAEGGRGFEVVRGLAAGQAGELSMVDDGDNDEPGKVVRVKMLLPDVAWPAPAPEDPWRTKGRKSRKQA